MIPHQTTMAPLQRQELVRILSCRYTKDELALLTDVQIHERWLIDCGYKNIYANPR